MKPAPSDLLSMCPSLPEAFVTNHIDRLGDEYFIRFTPADICRHIEIISNLSAEEPVQVLINEEHKDIVDCTIVAYNYRTQFSLITGIFASIGLIILSGDAFTYASPPPFVPDRRVRRSRYDRPDPLRRRYIVDRLSVVFADDEVAQSDWENALRERLTRVMRLMETGKEDDAVRARHLVNEMVADRLREVQTQSPPVLYPIDIRISNEDSPYTTVRVTSQDTPAFLYALTNALSLLWDISIERVRINTVHGMVQDVIEILDSRGEKIVEPERLDRIRLSVLLTKQFTYFLPRAPEPYAALCRFEYLSSEVVDKPQRSEWLQRFSNPETLKDLAVILGASDFIWEDFVRSQYESLAPILDDGTGGYRLSFTREAIVERLEQALAGASSYEEKRDRLNSWKDHEIFLIDLDHILHSGADVRALAEPLTRLAEVVVQKSTEIVYDRLVERYGVPRTVGGLRATYAVFGLGKMGGVALGYASDIELLFVFSDNGKTDGERSIDNAEFFEMLVEETSRFIRAKREGIFHVDLRLRPHGESGPKACSLESFCRYYGIPGEALSYERLALTRLRAIAGDMLLGLQVERLRDEFVYTSSSIDMEQLRQLRERQFEVKASGERYNAKFSPGALVDLEYYVQILQVKHGRELARLRTPRIHKALTALSEAGILEAEESQQLTEAYYFLRHLINGLRMLRGNALDLFLPAPNSDEYLHLARRMGYERTRDLDPQQQLFVDFETHTAVIRAFIEKYFGRESVPGSTGGNVVDLILSPDAPADLQAAIFSKYGLTNIERAYVNLKKLAGNEAQRDVFVRLAILAFDSLRRVPDPDMALNNWERFVHVLPDPSEHYRLLLSQPRRLEILLGIFAGSQFLADTLVRNPEFLDWVTNPDILRGARDKATIAEDLAAFTQGHDAYTEWLNALRRFRRREFLRIGTRDICLEAPIEDIMSDLSFLADAITDATLSRVWNEIPIPRNMVAPEAHFCILALGKLGGNELNYSSDIDLVGIYDDAAPGMSKPEAREVFARALERVRAALSEYTEEGYVYRVDLRLRPHGKSGELVQPISAFVHYYEKEATLWEIQALLKARPVAGNLKIGYKLIEAIQPLIAKRRERHDIIYSVKTMRERAMQTRKSNQETDIKTGLGGIRDVEFLVQGLQLLHLPDHPELLTGNTILAMDALANIGVIPREIISALKSDYLFLRRVEHYLQLLEDQQVHAIPQDRVQLAALAKRAMREKASTAEFVAELEAVQERIHRVYLNTLATD